MVEAGSFVRVDSTRDRPRLVVGGEPLRFAIGNAYYLTEEAARGRHDIVDETLGKLVGIGVRVVRAWAFNDDPNKLDSAIRRGPDRLEPAGLAGLDRLLARARAFGVRLILPLVNHWNAYGGARQWCAWGGLAAPVEGDPRFYSDAGVRGAFLSHVRELLSRENPITGVRYGDDPTVLAWELVNEPRATGLTEATYTSFVVEAAATVHAHAQQLVSIGDEGYERSLVGHDAAFWQRAGGSHLFAAEQGASYSRLVALPEIDLASVHFYPEKYGITPGFEEAAGVEWIEGHARIAHAAGKPVYVGELGLGNEGASFARFALPERRAIYRAWFEAADRAGIAGLGPWMFAHDSRPDRWDDFSWYVRDGLPLDAPENRYADLVEALAARLCGG